MLYSLVRQVAHRPRRARRCCDLLLADPSGRQGSWRAEDWKKVTDRYFSKEEQEHWAETCASGAEFHQAEYGRKWKDLGDRVEAAIPHGPDSPEAQALYDEWQELLAPFTAVATPRMIEGAKRLYDHMDEWERDVSTPFTSEVFRFMRDVGRLKEAGQMSSLTRLVPGSGERRANSRAAMLIAALALAALVGADEFRSSHRMLLGFSLDIANMRISLKAEAADIKRE